MNGTLLAALTFLGSRSRRLRPLMPFLGLIPVLFGAYELYRRHKANEIPAPAP